MRTLHEKILYKPRIGRNAPEIIMPRNKLVQKSAKTVFQNNRKLPRKRKKLLFKPLEKALNCFWENHEAPCFTRAKILFLVILESD